MNEIICEQCGQYESQCRCGDKQMNKEQEAKPIDCKGTCASYDKCKPFVNPIICTNTERKLISQMFTVKISRKELLCLPIETRRRILLEQASKLVSQPTTDLLSDERLYDIVEDSISWGILYPDFKKYHDEMESKIKSVIEALKQGKEMK